MANIFGLLRLETREGRRNREIRARQENARRMEEDRIHERKTRLRAIENHDLQVDKQLLIGGTNPLGDQAFHGWPWFMSKSVAGDRNYILQYMSRYVKSNADKQIMDRIEQLTSNLDWINSPFPGHAVVGPNIFASSTIYIGTN
jgi:type VI protein secretion system component VasK